MNPATLFAAACIAAGIALARRLRYEFNPGDIMPGMYGSYPKKKAPPDHHYTLDLPPAERTILLNILEKQEFPREAVIKYLAEKLRGARRHDGPPLPDAALPWRELEREARRQGCSPADVLFDRAKAKD